MANPISETGGKKIAVGFCSILFGMLAHKFINLACLLICGIGLRLTFPLTAYVVAAAYEQIFGLPNTQGSFS